MKSSLLCLILISSQFQFIRALNVECAFESFFGWLNLEYYRCSIDSPLSITFKNQVIDSANGTHSDDKNNSQVEEFFVPGLVNKIHYFPVDLESVFPHLKKIYMEKVGLKEIHQSDLKPFTELEILFLANNYIEYLEADLFKFNPKLIGFAAHFNQISYINSRVFDHLNALSSLFLSKNECNLRNSRNNRPQVENIIEEARENCSDLSRFLNFTITQFLIQEIRSDIENSNENLIMSEEVEVFNDVEPVKPAKLQLRDDFIDQNCKRVQNQLNDALKIRNVLIYIAIPVISFFTLLNVFLIIACLRRKF